jgi:hypothetical protein
MRATIATLAGLMALMSTSAHTVPLPSAKATTGELSSAPSIELLRQGYDWGWHRAHWGDCWGYWDWGRRIPNW